MNTYTYLQKEFIEETFFLFKPTNFSLYLGFSTLKVIHPGFLHLKSFHFGLHEEQQAEDEKILG